MGQLTPCRRVWAQQPERLTDCVPVQCLLHVGGMGGVEQDDLENMFQSAGALAFDLDNSDNENLAIAQHKAQKVCTTGRVTYRHMPSETRCAHALCALSLS